MTSLEIVGLVAIILISAFSIIGIIVAIPLFRLINRSKRLVDDLGESVVPMVEKLNNTVDDLNGELDSINDLTQNVSSIVEQLEKLIRLARLLVTNPIIKLLGTTTGLINAINKKTDNSSEGGKDK